MEITSHTTLTASAGTKIDPEQRRIDVRLDYRGTDKGALTSVSLSISQDRGYESWGGRTLQIKKDDTVGSRVRDPWTLQATDLPDDIVASLRAAAREALQADCERALAVLSDPDATL